MNSHSEMLDEELRTEGSYCTSANSSSPTGKQLILPAMLHDGNTHKITINSRLVRHQIKTDHHAGSFVSMEMHIPAMLGRLVQPSQAKPEHV